MLIKWAVYDWKMKEQRKLQFTPSSIDQKGFFLFECAKCYLKCVMDSFCKCFASLRFIEQVLPMAAMPPPLPPLLLLSADFWLTINSSLRFFLSRRIMRFLYFISCLSRCDIASSVGDSSSNAQRCLPFSWQSNSCRSSAINGGVIGLSLTNSRHKMSAESFSLGIDFMRGKLFNDTLMDR